MAPSEPQPQEAQEHAREHQETKEQEEEEEQEEEPRFSLIDGKLKAVYVPGIHSSSCSKSFFIFCLPLSYILFCLLFYFSGNQLTDVTTTMFGLFFSFLFFVVVVCRQREEEHRTRRRRRRSKFSRAGCYCRINKSADKQWGASVSGLLLC